MGRDKPGIQMNEPSLESPADHETLKVLRDAGALSSEAFWSGIREINHAQLWALWTRRLFLCIGATLVMAALVYFFAYNWEGLARWQKLALPQAVTLLALAGGQCIHFRRIGGQLLLFAAAVAVGVGFAVYGQIYQTGADAFGFFAMWSLCILPWVLVGTFAPLWVLWFTLVNLALWFFWDQVGQFHVVNGAYVAIVLAAVNGTGLLIREASITRSVCFRGQWLRPLLLLGTLTPVLVPALGLLLDTGSGGHLAPLLGTALWLLCLGGAYRFFTRVRYDSTALCIVLANAAVFLLFAIGRCFEAADLYDSGAGFLFMALAIGGVTTLLVRIMRHLKYTYQHEPANERGLW